MTPDSSATGRAPTPPYQFRRGRRAVAKGAGRAASAASKARRRGLKRTVARGYAKTHQRIVYGDRDPKSAPWTHKLEASARRMSRKAETMTKPYPWIHSQAKKGLTEGERRLDDVVRFLEFKERGLRDSYADLVRTAKGAWKEVRGSLESARDSLQKALVRTYVRLA